MSFLSLLIPTNLLSEKEKFFKDENYDPQFIYTDQIPEKKLVTYGHPSPEYLQLAQEIVSKAYFGRNEQDLMMLEGREVSKEKVEQTVKSFLQMHKLENRFQIKWSSSYVTRAAMNKNTVKLRLPADFRKEGLLGMIYHEIGTHAIRRVNYEEQPWFGKKKSFGFSNYLKTEEGLASINTLVPKSFKSAYNTALRYLAVSKAQQSSFSSTWRYMKQYVQNPDRRWDIVYRQKRGLKDTSKPGGYTKDLTYFGGMIDVWQYLEMNEFDPTQLYYGKLSIDDIDKAVELNPDFEPLLPSFYTLNPAKYARIVQEIGKENKFDQLKKA